MGRLTVHSLPSIHVGGRSLVSLSKGAKPLASIRRGGGLCVSTCMATIVFVVERGGLAIGRDRGHA